MQAASSGIIPTTGLCTHDAISGTDMESDVRRTKQTTWRGLRGLCLLRSRTAWPSSSRHRRHRTGPFTFQGG
eukprot:1557289-Rhodomonas_salina.1